MRQRYGMNLSERAEFEGQMAWGVIKACFWIAIGYWIRSKYV